MDNTTTNTISKKRNTTLPFIKTSDKETMENLKLNGFDLIDFNNGIWTFLNCANLKINFDLESNEKINFSNILCI